jgi:dipeptidyl aminopeptidase/acylaminoacyl peptidase
MSRSRLATVWLAIPFTIGLVSGLDAAPAGSVPPLIPRAALFGNAAREFPQVSPDGRQLSWLAPDAMGVQNVWVQTEGTDSARAVTHETHRPIRWYTWSASGSHLLYLQDGDGDENNHLFAVDLKTGASRDLTPFRGVRAQNVLVDQARPGDVLVALNQRDRRMFDLYRVDLAAGTLSPEAENTGDVLSWTPDADFVIRGATAFDTTTGATVIRVRDGAGKPWRDVVRMPFERALFAGQYSGGSLIAGFAADGKSLYVHSALGTGMGRLVRVDASTGAEFEVVASHPRSDLPDDPQAAVMFDHATHRVLAVQFDPGTPEWKFLDARTRDDFARIGKVLPGFAQILSADAAGRRWVLAISNSDAPDAYVAYDRKTHVVTPLYSAQPALASTGLAKKQVVTIPARDGLPLVSYLTLPPGVEPHALPLVLLVHGGPWVRDGDGFDPQVQLLANRGYAVLQVNYRGSTGFGLAFYNAGNDQWGRGMQEDLYDAVRWAIAKGIADPRHVASMGWSGGGYATLNALWQQPDMFACGVDGVGPADLRVLFQSFPRYWVSNLERWRRRVGDVEHDDALWKQISPQFHVDAIRAPLLIGQGQNDPRVSIANADAMVKALRDAGRQVTYVVYPDEGHGFARPENNLDFFGRVEEFLAKFLGGRAEPWRPEPGATAELR